MMGLAELRQLEKRVEAQTPRPRRPLHRYRLDPVGYARDVLGLEPSAVQQEIALATLEPPFRIAVQSGHNTGKSWAGGWLINWWYDTRDPGTVITTAPTATHVRDVLWREVRLQRGNRGDWIGSSAPELRSAPDHYAKGFTTGKSEAFHGRHDGEMLFLVDEAVGVDAIFAEVIRSMFKPQPGHAWVLFFNPTDTTSWVYQEVRSGRWKVICMSSLDHPNIVAELRGEPPPIPQAVSLSQIEAAIQDDCEPVPDTDRQPEDFEFPRDSGRWYRAGPIFQCRWLGQWPTLGTYGVWSEALWNKVVSDKVPAIPPHTAPEIGCDVACFGDDDTVLIARIGPVAVHYERHNGWDEVRTAARLKELARELAVRYQWLPERIAMKIDDDGVGGAVVNILRAPDNSAGWLAVPVNASTTPLRPDDYPNKRSELWFLAREKAKKGLMHLGLLARADLERLGTELMAPRWAPDLAGRRVVEKKDETKKTLRRSPDSADALNLAFYTAPTDYISIVEHESEPWHERRGHGFGR